MKTNVLINVKGFQGGVKGQDEIEMMVTGFLYEKNDKIYIQYIDTSLDSEIETKTSVKINDDKVSITRFGALGTHMIFEKDISHFTPYETPYGIFELKTHTKDINIDKDENGLKLSVEYYLDINKISSGLSYFQLEVTKL